MAVPPIVALEIGTSKVIALVGERREDGHIMITGIGDCPSSGVRKGEIINLDNAVTCVRSALSMAEESGKVAVHRVHLAVSGGHIQSVVNRGAAPVLDREGEINQKDIDQVIDLARAVNLGADREILHTVCQHFCIDDQKMVIQPEGMEGAKLSVDMLILHGMRTALHNAVKVARSVPMDVQDVAFSGLCSALSVLTPEQKKSGVVVLDLGGGTTDYLVYAGSVLAAAGALGVGGDHITNDIALALNIPMSQAEQLKRGSGSAMVDTQNPARKVSLPPEGGFSGRTVNLQSLHTVIYARVDEIFGMVADRLGKEGVLERVGTGVVLTGGGAYLNRIDELGERVFGLPCAVGKPRNVSGLATATEGAEYATCSGLVQYGFRTSAGTPGWGGPLTDWLKGFFGK